MKKSKTNIKQRVRKKNQKERAITLIALAVTIIVLLILAGVAISLSIGEKGIVSKSQVSVEGNKLASYKEKLEMYKAEKLLEDETFIEETLSAGKNTLEYNTKKESEGTILNVIPELDDNYMDKLEIIKGELFLTSTNKLEIQAAKIAGIEFNPYKIEDGELQSSDTNLELMSSDGTLTIPNNVSKIGYGAFSNVEGLKTIIIPETVKEIGPYAFAYNSTLEKVIIKDGVEKIGEYAFIGDERLKEIILPNTLKEAGTKTFASTKIEKINIPGSLTVIPANFITTTALKEITLNEGTQTISSQAFLTAQISSIKLSSTITQISTSAFGSCTLLENFDLSENKNFTYESGFLMTAKNPKIIFVSPSFIKSNSTFNIPEGMTNLDISLTEYTNIKKVIIPKSLNKLNPSFLPKSVEEIEVVEGNTTYTVENGFLYDNNKKLQACLSRENIITVPNGITEIVSSSFKFANNVTEIFLPDTVIYLGNGFRKNIKIHVGKKVKSIVAPIFDGQNGELIIDEDNPYYIVENRILYTKTDEKELVNILYSARDEDLIISKDTKSIGSYAFYGQPYLTNVILSDGVKKIKTNAFRGVPKLVRLEIPKTIEVIEENTFGGSSGNLNEIIIHKEKDSIQGAPWGAVKGMRAIKWVK